MKKISFPGGKVLVPLSQTENDNIVALADDYATICQRNLYDGRTFWLGIQTLTDQGTWMVRNNFSLNILTSMISLQIF